MAREPRHESTNRDVAINLKERALLVDTVGSALSRGEHTLTVIPDLIHQLLEDEAWKEFETKMGKHVTYDRFEDFVTTPPLAGLGANMELIERLVKDKPKTRKLLRKVLKRPIGKPGHNTDNISIINQSHGTSQAYALEVLEEKRPDLLEQVEAGEMSANAAMLEARLRPPKISVRLDNAESAAKTLLTHASPEFIEELTRLLNDKKWYLDVGEVIR